MVAQKVGSWDNQMVVGMASDAVGKKVYEKDILRVELRVYQTVAW